MTPPDPETTAQVAPTRRVTVLPDAEAVAREAARRFVQRASAAGNRPFRVALSGGSTPRRFLGLLGGELAGEVPWGTLDIWWGDERHVPPEHADSNFRMASETLLAGGRVPPERIHRIHGELSDASRSAALYESDLQAGFALRQGGLPRFDLVLLGMGPDGHTASLFPGTTALAETSRLVAATHVDKLDADRITLTLPVLNAAAAVLFVIAGADKAAALGRVLADGAGSPATPASLVRPVRGALEFVVDAAAAPS